MNNLVDHIGDSNHSILRRISNVWPLPDYVKDAALTDKQASVDLDIRYFADMSNRQFPVHNQADAWLSTAFYQQQRGPLSDTDPIARRLKQACALWGIEPQDASKLAAPVEDPTCWVEYPLSKVHRVPIYTTDHLRKCAADAMTKGKYPWAVRRDVCRQIIRAPRNLSQPLLQSANGRAIYKTAGHGVGSTASALQTIDRRRHALTPAMRDAGKLLDKAAACVPVLAREGMLGPEAIDKIAGFVDAVDRLTGAWQTAQVLPEQALVSITTRDFPLFRKNAVFMPNGKVVRRQELLKAGATAILHELGSTSPDLQTAIRLLPYEKALTFSTIMESSGAA